MDTSAGSVWRKWDLHLHTPASYDYENMSITNEQIIEALVAADVSVVAITDHHSMNVPGIKELQSLAGANLTVLPGIEFRSELGGRESVHFCGIFPEDCDLQKIWDNLNVRLRLSEQVERVGPERVYVDLRDAATLIRGELGGIVTVHAGRKTNSVESISNCEVFKQQVKTDVVLGCVDIFELGQLRDRADYEDRVFPNLDRHFPMIICSDNHRADRYGPENPCWLKADPSFLGLRQVLNEPKDRIYLGALPPKLAAVQAGKTKYIHSVSIAKEPGSEFDEVWFDGTSLRFNHDLVAIIGNKGSGKSALADTLGLLGDSRQYESFSFLHPEKFKRPRENKARHFRATLKWESGLAIDKNLDDAVSVTEPETIKYLPQHYIEATCNETATDGKGDFDRELEKAIFSHVPLPDRLGKSSLEELIEYKTSETMRTIDILKGGLGELNRRIVELEERSTPEFRETIQRKLNAKQQELRLHLGNKPEAIEKPGEDPKLQGKMSKIAGIIDAKKEELKELEIELRRLAEEELKQARLSAAVEKVVKGLDNLSLQVEYIREALSGELALLGLTFEQVVKVELDKKPLFSIRDALAIAREDMVRKLDVDASESPAHKEAMVRSELGELQRQLDEPNARYQSYLESLEAWNAGQAAILGSEDAEDTVRFYERQLRELDEIPKRLGELKEERIKRVKAIHKEIAQLATTYRELYQPVQDFIQDHPVIKDKLRLEFEASIVDTGFQRSFLERLNRGAAGSFCGVPESEAVVRGLVDKYDFNSERDVVAFLDELLVYLTSDQRMKPAPKMQVKSQLRRGHTVEELYDFLFSLDYLRPKYTLKLGGKLPHQLSPGEKGTLLLVFYLLVDKGDVPLIIDQPEDNLDNQTVYDILVPCIREAKQRRQVFIVTHNPNLAVVCDAEQLIYASRNQADLNRVTYMTGAIENPLVNKHALDVLEGTRPAFDNRDAKYFAED